MIGQEATGLLADDPVAVRTRALFAAFDGAAGVRADLVLFDRDEPLAGAALRAWATLRGRVVDERPIPEAGTYRTCLTVRPPAGRSIDVFIHG